MTLRDRLVLTCVVVLVAIVAAWVLVVSPERKKASESAAQLATAKTQLASAESELANARHAQARYEAAYSTIVSLGKAVPTTQEVPALIFELAKASNHKGVQFASITTGTAGAAGASSSASSGAAANAATAGFSQVPFTFVFNGSYFSLEHMLRELASLTTRGHAGGLRVNGRLLTIQSVKLSPASESGKTSTTLSATIAASAYELPAEAAGSGAGAGASASGGAAPTAAGGAAGPTTPPAIVRVKP